jgi:hypothetical protein
LLRQIEKPVRDVARRVQRTTKKMKEPQSPQRRKQVRSRFDPLAQITRGRVTCRNVGAAPATRGHQFRPQSDQKNHLVRVALGRCGQILQQRQCALEMLLRPDVCAPAAIRFTGVLAIDDRPFRIACMLEMHREFGGDLGCSLTVRRFEAHPNQSMQHRASSD